MTVSSPRPPRRIMSRQERRHEESDSAALDGARHRRGRLLPLRRQFDVEECARGILRRGALAAGLGQGYTRAPCARPAHAIRRRASATTASCHISRDPMARGRTAVMAGAVAFVPAQWARLVLPSVQARRSRRRATVVTFRAARSRCSERR